MINVCDRYIKEWSPCNPNILGISQFIDAYYRCFNFVMLFSPHYFCLISKHGRDCPVSGIVWLWQHPLKPDQTPIKIHLCSLLPWQKEVIFSVMLVCLSVCL